MSLESYTSWLPQLASAIGVIIGVGTLISRKISGMDERHNAAILAMTKQYYELDKRVTINETYDKMFWKDYKMEAGNAITQPHTPEIDAYMVLMRQREKEGRDLTRDEKEALVRLLQDTTEKNYDVPAYVAPNMGTYAALLARFRTELKMEEIVKDIDKKYADELKELERIYHEKIAKKRNWKLW